MLDGGIRNWRAMALTPVFCAAATVTRPALPNRKLHDASCVMRGSGATSVPKSFSMAWHA